LASLAVVHDLKGISMAPALGCRPVQIKTAVDDVDAAVTFYQQAFGFHYDVTRRTDEADYSGFAFGTYGGTDFWLS
jgi:predicted enzyme related to lactoylglutathione lyase